jgi:hypothetical protein
MLFPDEIRVSVGLPFVTVERKKNRIVGMERHRVLGAAILYDVQDFDCSQQTCVMLRMTEIVCA